jgi:hypothetical protein
MNFIRKHALAYQKAEQGCDLETRRATGCLQQRGRRLRLQREFPSDRQQPPGRTMRTSWPRPTRGASASPIGRSGTSGSAQAELLNDRPQRGWSMAYQNLDSVELGVTTDRPLLRYPRRHFRKRRYPLAQRVQAMCRSTSLIRHRGDGKVRTLSEQVALGDPDPRSLNPKWYEGMLASTATRACARSRSHDHQYHRLVRHHRSTVAPWVYQKHDRDLHVLDEADAPSAWRR